MMSQVYIACDGDWDEPEVQISGSVEELNAFGKLLNSIEDRLVLEVSSLENEFYPVSIGALEIKPEKREGGRLTVTIDSKKFMLQGTNEAFNKLGDSLLNYFDDNSNVGDHFQLDYYDGNEVLDKTNCHLIFICDR